MPGTILTDTVEINGREYRIDLWPALAGLENISTVLKFIGPFKEDARAMYEGAKKSGTEQVSALIEGVIGMAGAVNPKKLREIVNLLLKGLWSVDKEMRIGDPNVFFTDKKEDLFPLVIEVFKHQILPFMSGNVRTSIFGEVLPSPED